MITTGIGFDHARINREPLSLDETRVAAERMPVQIPDVLKESSLVEVKQT